MTAIDTSTWLNNELWTHTTSALETYATNVPNGWTLLETSSRQNSGSDRVRNSGIRVVNDTNGTSNGVGKSVRPPQRFTYTFPANEGGGHIHYVPNLREFRIRGTSVNEGGETSTVPTGIISFAVELLRLSSLPAQTSFPSGNDAEIEVDIRIFNRDDSTKVAALNNYPLSTLGPGTNWSPTHNRSWISRTGLGVTNYDRHQITHNTQSNAWSFANWSLQQMWAETGKWVVAYRIESPVSPYYLTNVASSAGGILNTGIYVPSAPPVYIADNSARIRLRASGGVSVGSQVSPALLMGGNRISLTNQRALLNTGVTIAGRPNSVRLRVSGGIQVGGASVLLVGANRIDLHGVGALNGLQPTVQLRGGNTDDGFRLVQRGIDLLREVGGSGFIPTVLWNYRR